MNDVQNTYYAKLTGKVNIPESLEIGTNYSIEAKGTVTQKKEDDNFDGSLSVTYKFEPVEIIFKEELGKAIKARDPRSNSQKLRSFLWKMWHDEGVVEEFEKVYDEFTMVVCAHMPALLRETVKRLENK